MSNITITQLPTAGALTGTEAVPVVQNGVTVQTTTGAIQATSNLTTYPFLMTQATSALGSSRYVATGSGLSTADGGAGSTFTINLTGAPLSLVTSGTGIQVKTNSTTLVNRTITITGSGLAITNGDGISGNPTISTTGVLANFASTSGTGLVTINGTTVSQTTITGTSGQITVTNGNASGGNPTIAIADNPVLTGTAGLQLPTGNTSQRSNVNGLIRYNSQTTRFEGYEGGNWSNLGTGDGTVTSVTGTANQITVANSTTTPVVSIVSNPIIPGVASITLPAGGTSARPFGPTNGMLRYNSDLGVFEGYANSVWGAITTGSGVTSVATGIGLTGGPITTTGTISLSNTSVTSGSYGNGSTVATFTVNGQGQLTAASGVAISIPSSAINTSITNAQLANSSVSFNGVAVSLGGSGTITASTTSTLTIGTGLSGGSFNGGGPVTIAISNTAVTAGSYTNASITVNAQGQVTSASSGSATVSSFQTSLSGLTPSTATTGVVTLAGTLGISSGGTGQTTASSAFNALSPITTTGDLIIGNGTNSATRLAIGANTFVLTSNGTTASWQASSGVTSFSAGTTGFTPSSATTGAVVLAGTLVASNGGTGVAGTLTGVLYGNGTSAHTVATAAQVVSTIGTTAVTNSTNTTNILGGATGSVPYNSASGTTTFLALGTSGYVLTAGASAPAYVAQSTLSVGTATNATNVALTAGSGATNYLHFSSSATGNQPVNTNASLTYNYTNNALTAGINGGTF